MGLDMYAYHIRKASEEDIKKLKESDIYPDEATPFSNGFGLLHADTDTEDLACLAEKVKLKVPYLDEDKVKKYSGIPKDGNLVCQVIERDGTQKRTYSFAGPDGKWKEGIVKLTPEIQKKLTAYDEEEFYPVDISAVGYWRKAYDLQDKIYELYQAETGKSIENCGYHRCSQEMLDALGIEEMPDEGAVFYHEWY